MKPADARCPACSSQLAGIDLAKTVLASPPNPADDTAPPPPPRRSGIGGRFGRYEIVEKLGEGGMGTVYKARDPQLGRFVALKVLRAQRSTDGPSLVARFQREARAAAKLRHPNIVQIHDVGVVEDEYYLTMDYIDGESMQTLLGDAGARRRPAGGAAAAQRPLATPDGKPGQAQRHLTLNQGLSTIRDMAFALDSAHKQGIVHRDVKPANILVDKAGTPFLADFGLAKDFKEVAKSGVTVDGQFMGTPMYFSPEQAAGDTARIGPASDVYSLGVIMYQLLTGVMPYEADSFLALAWQIMNTEPAAPSRVSATVPRDLEAICLKAIEKASRHRYQDARAFGEDVGRYLAGEAVLARTPGLPERILRRAMRKKIQSAVVVAALLAGIGLGAYFWASSAGREAAVRSNLDEAKALEDKGEFSRARDLYLIVLQGEPENSDALAGRARVDAALSAQVAEQASERARAETRSEVEKLLREAEKTWGDATNVLQNTELPIEKYHNGIEKAMRLYDEAEKKMPDYGCIYESRGRLRLHLNDLDGAEADLKKAANLLGPREAKAAHRSLARLYIERAFELTYERPEKVATIMARAADLTTRIQTACDAADGEIWQDDDEEAGSAAALLKAFGLYSTGGGVAAESMLKKTLEEHGTADLAYLLAMMAGLRRDSKSEMEYLNKALKIQPRHVRGLVFRAYANYLNGNEKKGVEDCTEALKGNPGYPHAYFVRGLCEVSLENLDAAIADFSKALELKPDCDLVLIQRGHARRQKGDIDAAISDYDACLKIDDKDAYAYAYRGRAYEAAGLQNSALEDYDRAIKCGPRVPDSYHFRGLLRLSKSDFDGAIADFAELIKLNDSDQVAFYNRAVARYSKGDFDGAVVDSCASLKLKSDDDNSLYIRGLARMGKSRKVEDQAERAGLIDAAIEDYTAALKLRGTDAQTLFARAIAFIEKENKQGAVSDLEKALANAPENWAQRDEAESLLKALKK